MTIWGVTGGFGGGGHEPDHRHGREQGVGDRRADELQLYRGRVHDQRGAALEIAAEGRGHR